MESVNPMAAALSQRKKVGLKEIALVFFRLGVVGFGGPVAVVQMLEAETVARRGWVTEAEFKEAYAVCKLLPGPVSTQISIHIGRLVAGTIGGIVAGLTFIFPAFVLILGLSVAYTRFGYVPGTEAAMSGLKAVGLAIIAHSTWGLAKPYLRKRVAWVIVPPAALCVYFYPSYEPAVILGCGIFGAYRAGRGERGAGTPSLGGRGSRGEGGGLKKGTVALLAGALALVTSRAVASVPSVQQSSRVLLSLFWMCCKAGFFVFGTGLAVVPVLEADSVGHHHWLTHPQFLDGLALGQVTPGPVVITATFIGYLAAGLSGALAATFGMFFPSFFNTLVLLPRAWDRLSGTSTGKGFSEYAIPAVVGGILGATTRLGVLALDSWQPLVIFVAALAASIRFKAPPWVLVPIAAGMGAALGR